ncbi:hypothetical protein Scep_018579 [Stephania cephalantha]|uniref:PLAT domain-containing protein n=1 Tax=Stephania cephalantha TaxID=152367 RepID=A0AAP0I9E1_9MAGN
MELIRVDSLLIALLFCTALIYIAQSDDSANCVYTVYVRTGSEIKSGTDSNISLRLYDGKGLYLEIPNLEAWGGLMGPGYDYFERGNLDIFSGRGPCLTAPVCAVKVTSDGSGPHHGWFLRYVEVTSTGPHIHCAKKIFPIEQWLGTDVAPYTLTVLKNFCSKDALLASPKPLESSELVVMDDSVESGVSSA